MSSWTGSPTRWSDGSGVEPDAPTRASDGWSSRDAPVSGPGWAQTPSGYAEVLQFPRNPRSGPARGSGRAGDSGRLAADPMSRPISASPYPMEPGNPRDQAMVPTPRPAPAGESIGDRPGGAFTGQARSDDRPGGDSRTGTEAGAERERGPQPDRPTGGEPPRRSSFDNSRPTVAPVNPPPRWQETARAVPTTPLRAVPLASATSQTPVSPAAPRPARPATPPGFQTPQTGRPSGERPAPANPNDRFSGAGPEQTTGGSRSGPANPPASAAAARPADDPSAGRERSSGREPSSGRDRPSTPPHFVADPGHRGSGATGEWPRPMTEQWSRSGGSGQWQQPPSTSTDAADAVPVSAAPVSATPTSGTPASEPPVGTTPTSGGPASGGGPDWPYAESWVSAESGWPANPAEHGEQAAEPTEPPSWAPRTSGDWSDQPPPGWSDAGPPTPGWSDADPPTPGWSDAGPPTPGWSDAGPPTPGWSDAGPPPPGWSDAGDRSWPADVGDQQWPGDGGDRAWGREANDGPGWSPPEQGGAPDEPPWRPEQPAPANLGYDQDRYDPGQPWNTSLPGPGPEQASGPEPRRRTMPRGPSGTADGGPPPGATVPPPDFPANLSTPIAAAALDTLPQRVPADPDVPTVPQPPAVEPSAETPELARIASHLRRGDSTGQPQERPEGFDVKAILAAVRGVGGVRDASLRTTDAGAHSLRLDLAEGADPAEVSRMVARLLQERMGLAAAPQNLPGAFPGPSMPTAPMRGGPLAGTQPADLRSGPDGPAMSWSAPDPVEVPRRRRLGQRPQPGYAGVAAVPTSAVPASALPYSDSGTGPESGPPRPLNPGGRPGPRVVLNHVQVSTFGVDATVEVHLTAGPRTTSGLATGPAVDSYVLRLCAVAAASAIEELLTGPSGTLDRGRCFVEHAAVVPMGGCEVAVAVVLLACGGWVEQLAGSAVVAGDPRQAVVRATLAAVNRRLDALLA
ncbi:hypothetical protein [Micromonospora sp. LOL_023]|uniref:hypothetical protein n=1 Tax=Micromonospora sp. LOL_023 TaxID=3345418 RepID=UPI003A898822